MKRIIVVSIIGIDRFTSGYQAAKIVHENAMRSGPVPVRILRAAQFHEFVGQLVEWGRQGDLSVVPKMRTQPSPPGQWPRRSPSSPSPGRCVDRDRRTRRSSRSPARRTERLADAARRLVARRGDTLRIEEANDPSDPIATLYANGALLPGPDALWRGPRSRRGSRGRSSEDLHRGWHGSRRQAARPGAGEGRTPGRRDHARARRRRRLSEAAGAVPAVLDALDRAAVLRAVVAARPDVVVHQMTALASVTSVRNVDAAMAASNRLRTEGTDHLLAAARAAGARRFVAAELHRLAQRARGRPGEDGGGPAGRAPGTQHGADAGARSERWRRPVLGATDLGGIVLRYGAFYGPGTSVEPGGFLLEAVRKRRLPIIGGGAGIWSFSHVADIAEATRLAIEAGPPGPANIVDDEPAEVSVWLPELARAIGAKPPFRLPVWLGRLLAGDVAVRMMTEQRGSSNAKAKRLLGWQPTYSTWRDGFRRGLQRVFPGHTRRERPVLPVGGWIMLALRLSVPTDMTGAQLGRLWRSPGNIR